MNSEYLSIISIFLTTLGFLFLWFGIISGMKERISRLETKMELFWKAIENNVSALLKTFPTNINKDVLLDKLSNGELSMEEAQTLRTILIGEMEKFKNKKIAYILMLARIEQLIYEFKKPKKHLWKYLKSLI